MNPDVFQAGLMTAKDIVIAMGFVASATYWILLFEMLRRWKSPPRKADLGSSGGVASEGVESDVLAPQPNQLSGKKGSGDVGLPRHLADGGKEGGAAKGERCA